MIIKAWGRISKNPFFCWRRVANFGRGTGPYTIWHPKCPAKFVLWLEPGEDIFFIFLAKDVKFRFIETFPGVYIKLRIFTDIFNASILNFVYDSLRKLNPQQFHDYFHYPANNYNTTLLRHTHV